MKVFPFAGKFIRVFFNHISPKRMAILPYFYASISDRDKPNNEQACNPQCHVPEFCVIDKIIQKYCNNKKRSYIRYICIAVSYVCVSYRNKLQYEGAH